MVEVLHDDFELDFDYDNYVWNLEEEMEKIKDTESFERIIWKQLKYLDSLIDLSFDKEDDIFSSSDVIKDLGDDEKI